MFEDVFGLKAYPVECTMFGLKNTLPDYQTHKIMLVYCLNGEVDFFAGNCIGKLKEGELLYVNRDELYHFESSSKNDILMAYLDVPKRTFFKKGTVCTEKTQQVEEIKDLLLTIAFMMFSDKIYDYSDCMAVCESLIERAVQLFTIEMNGKHSQMIREIVEMINSSYSEGLTVEQIALKYGMDPKSISGIFKKAGVGRLFEYLTYVRCVHAAVLLYESTDKVEKISVNCGFTSTKMFYRHFREFAGDTPKRMALKYRRLNNCKYKQNLLYGSHHISQTAIRILGERSAMKIKESCS